MSDLLLERDHRLFDALTDEEIGSQYPETQKPVISNQ
jgi:hypothetical protein